MNKTIDALKLAENTLEDIIRVYKFETGTPVTTLAAIREVLAEQSKCACDSPAWCTKYKKCNREMLGLPKAEPAKQEPVAIVDANDKGYWADILHDRDVKVGQLLYAAPVKREWVDLTDDEIFDAYTSDAHENTPKSFARAVVAAWKAKNEIN